MLEQLIQEARLILLFWLYVPIMFGFALLCDLIYRIVKGK